MLPEQGFIPIRAIGFFLHVIHVLGLVVMGFLWAFWNGLKEMATSAFKFLIYQAWELEKVVGEY